MYIVNTTCSTAVQTQSYIHKTNSCRKKFKILLHYHFLYSAWFRPSLNCPEMWKVIILVQDHSKYEIIFVSKEPMVVCQMWNVSELIKNCVIWTPDLSMAQYWVMLMLSDGFILSYSTEICINKVYKAQIMAIWVWHYDRFTSGSLEGAGTKDGFINWKFYAWWTST